MIKIEVVQDFIDPSEELTKEKCMLYILRINDTMKNTRANIYQLFLGTKSLKYAVYLVSITFLMFFIFRTSFLLTIAIIEFIAYLMISILLSEYLTKKLKSSLYKQKLYFKDKLDQIQKSTT